MTKTNVKQAQGGFTLIEIIAVLVILGILAAVATPRFTGLQEEARVKGMESLVSASQSQLSMTYSEQLLNKGSASEAWSHIDSDDSAQDVCDRVSKDGWLNDATLECTSGTDVIDIKVEYDGMDTSGTFSDPDED